MRKTCVILGAMALSILCAATAPAQEAGDVYVSDLVIPQILDVDLRDLKPAPAWRPGDPVKVVPEGIHADFGGPEVDPDWVDPLRQDASRGPGFDGFLIESFFGIPFGAGWPPDVIGDVGPDHYIGMVNASRFGIWDKFGNALVPPTTLSTLWTVNGGNPGSPCADGDGDPVVQYDELADRWLMSEFDLTGNSFCIYISRGADPVTSGWFVYDFSAPSFPDYPRYGVWPDAYYVSTFEPPSLGIYAFDRVSMLAGMPATFQRFTIPQLIGTAARVTRILPADHDGEIAPSAGLPGPFARTVDDTQDNSDPTDRIEMWEFDVDFVTPANSTFTNTQDLLPAAFTLLPCMPSTRDCVPQPGTTVLVDALFNRALRRLAWRVVDGEAVMVVTQVVDAGGGTAGKRWWELRSSTTAQEGPGWSIFQEGTYSPDSVGRFMGSVAVNKIGDIALGYSVSDATSVLPGIRVTGRKRDDPAGAMTMNELTIKDGEGVQTANARWGDYSSMNVDPADDMTFWYTNQIIGADGFWQTWIGSFHLDALFIDSFEDGTTDAWSSTTP